METGIKSSASKTTTIVVCVIGLSAHTLAAPPSGKISLPPEAVSTNVRQNRLDLRLPDMTAIVAHGSGIQSTAAGQVVRFPSTHRVAANDDPEPEMSLGSAQVRIPGTAEAFVQRFRKEGLPIARLWENHSALVSLGLNQKGKPGLWLVQKTH